MLFTSWLCKNVAAKRKSSLWMKECIAEPVPHSEHLRADSVLEKSKRGEGAGEGVGG